MVYGMISTVRISGLRLPGILVAGRFPLADRGFLTSYGPGHTHALHVHGYSGYMRIGDGGFTLSSGAATISPSGLTSSYDLTSHGWHWCIHFTAEDGDLAIPLFSDLGPDASYARSRMARITALHEQSRSAIPGATTAAAAALLELLAWLVGRAVPSSRPSRATTAVERVATLIRCEPHRSWRTAALAARTGVSPNWLAARFHERFAMTIDRFRLVQRIEMARLLLGSTSLPVAEIGTRVGLPNPQHFNKVFRAILGVPPSACRGEATRLAHIRH
jgi:AraC-like DNA-binding protein